MRRLRELAIPAMLPFLVTACPCGTTGTDTGTDATPPTDSEVGFDSSTDGASDSSVNPGSDAGTLSCASSATTTLPGVHVDFPDQPCVFTLAQAAAGISIDYSVVVENVVNGVIPDTQDAGRCGIPGASGLILFETLGGAGQSYCLCDTGLCAGPPMTPVQLPAGSFPSAFTWTGRNWSGPSDTGNPMGAPFPPGTYTLTVSAVGAWNGSPFDVQTTYRVHLIP